MVGRHFVAYANFKATIQRFTGIAVDGRTESPKKNHVYPTGEFADFFWILPKVKKSDAEIAGLSEQQALCMKCNSKVSPCIKIRYSPVYVRITLQDASSRAGLMGYCNCREEGDQRKRPKQFCGTMKQWTSRSNERRRYHVIRTFQHHSHLLNEESHFELCTENEDSCSGFSEDDKVGLGVERK